MNRICVDENIPFAKEFFKDFGQVSTFEGRNLQSNALNDCDILIVRSVTQVNHQLLAGTPVKFVGTATAGTNHINKDELEQLGIPWFSAAGCNAKAVSEYVLAILLDLYQQDLSPEDTIGIIGYGKVGQSLADKLDILNIPWMASDPPRQSKYSDIKYQSLEDLNHCKILTFHVPYTQTGPHPTHQIWKKSLWGKWQQKPTIINACRGEIFEERELLENEFQIFADVFWDEPQPALNYLKECQLATPHIAGYSLRGKLNGSAILVEKLNDFLGTSHPIYQGAFLNRTSTMRWYGSLLDSLYRWMPSHYHPNSDFEDFKQTWDSRQRADQFDQLRKNYPIRPEFEDVSLTLEGSWPSSEILKLEKLGFSVQK